MAEVSTYYGTLTALKLKKNFFFSYIFFTTNLIRSSVKIVKQSKTYKICVKIITFLLFKINKCFETMALKLL